MTTTILDLIEDAAGSPTASVTFVTEGVVWSLPQLWDEAEKGARWLRTRVPRNGTVAALLSNTSDCARALIGAWRAGLTVASLPHPARGVSPEVYGAQLARFCDLAGADLLLVPASLADLGLDLSIPIATFETTGEPAPRCDTFEVGALVQFSSGSTGVPRGVRLPLTAVAANVLAILDAAEAGAGDLCCSWLPLSHDMGLIGTFLSSLAGCGPQFGMAGLALMTPESYMMRPGRWLKECSAVGATTTCAPNFALDLARRSAGRAGPLDLSRMRMLITGAEEVKAETLRAFAEAYAPAGLDPLSLCPAYGLAEATLAVTMVRPREHWSSFMADGREMVGNGRPLAGMEVRISTGDGSLEGGSGQIEVRGPSVARQFVGESPLFTPDGYLKTKDLGFVDGGQVYVAGRSDDLIIVAGRNFYPADIESAVHHDAVRPGCVAAVAAGGGVAIVLEPRVGQKHEDLERACREVRASVTAEIGVAPVTVAFIPKGHLPKTPSGKVQRFRLRAALAQGCLETQARLDVGAAP